MRKPTTRFGFVAGRVKSRERSQSAGRWKRSLHHKTALSPAPLHWVVIVLKFEKHVPVELRKNGAIVRTVGELMDVLSRLPRELPVDGDFCNGMYQVAVTRIADGNKDRLALTVEGYPDDLDEDDE